MAFQPSITTNIIMHLSAFNHHEYYYAFQPSPSPASPIRMVLYRKEVVISPKIENFQTDIAIPKKFSSHFSLRQTSTLPHRHISLTGDIHPNVSTNSPQISF